MRQLLQSRWASARGSVGEWLQQGLTPRQLALTLALGFAIGCIPLLGVTTAICTVLALSLRLNMPAIQAANWVAMPFQVFLLLPFLRLGQWLFSGSALRFSQADLMTRLESGPWSALEQMSGLLGHALFAWLITAGPVFLLLTAALTMLLRRVPRLAAAEAGD